ncbi:MAG: methionine--tRNA ligase subunit beta [Candidatus Eisenbacteria sp.]|nr:methionine--tRNA ligase subunit beta [Candidatus Eisenbacteria bacterium]
MMPDEENPKARSGAGAEAEAEAQASSVSGTQPGANASRKPQETSGKPEVSFDVFTALDIRTAKVLSAEKHPNADKLLVLRIDVGELGQRQIVAGIAPHYDPGELVGKTIAIVANLKPVRLRGVESQGMLMAASGEDRVVLLTMMTEVPPGWPVG